MTSGKALRFPPIPFEEMTDAQKQVIRHYETSWRSGVLKQGSMGGPLDATLRSPDMALRLSNLSTYFRPGTNPCTALAPRLNQFAIIIVSREWTSQYAWQVHSKWAVEAGLSAEIVDAVGNGKRPAKMQDDEEAVYDFLMELQRDRRVKDATFARAKSLLGDRQLIDLIGVASYYTLVCMELTAIDAPPLDDTLPMLPPLLR